MHGPTSSFCPLNQTLIAITNTAPPYVYLRGRSKFRRNRTVRQTRPPSQHFCPELSFREIQHPQQQNNSVWMELLSPDRLSAAVSSPLYSHTCRYRYPDLGPPQWISPHDTHTFGPSKRPINYYHFYRTHAVTRTYPEQIKTRSGFNESEMTVHWRTIRDEQITTFCFHFGSGNYSRSGRPEANGIQTIHGFRLWPMRASLHSPINRFTLSCRLTRCGSTFWDLK